MIAPRLAQSVCAIIAAETYLCTDGFHELVGLTPTEGFVKPFALGIEEDKVSRVVCDGRIGSQILGERLLDAVVDRHLVALAAFFLAEGEASARFPLRIDEISDLELEQVRDT